MDILLLNLQKFQLAKLQEKLLSFIVLRRFKTVKKIKRPLNRKFN